MSRPNLHKLKLTFAGLFIALCAFTSFAQSYFGLSPQGPSFEGLFFRTQLEANHAGCIGSGTCDQDYVASVWDAHGDVTMTPEGDLYYWGMNQSLWEIDTTTGAFFQVYYFPPSLALTT